MTVHESFRASAAGQSNAAEAVTVVRAEGAGPSLQVGAGNFLITAQFVRMGDDLLLVGQDGGRILVQDYFATANPPTLVSGYGAEIPGDLAAALAGPANPGMYAQVGAPEAKAAIGAVEALTGEATVMRTDGTRVALAVGQPVFQGDVVETAQGARLAIVLVDKTTFSLDSGTRMVLDELVYDPGVGGRSGFSLVQGTFVYISGEIAKLAPQNVNLRTPVAIVGVRGTEVGFVILGPGDGGAASVTVIEGAIAVTNQAGEQLLSVGFTATINSALIAPSAPILTPLVNINAQYGALRGYGINAITNSTIRQQQEQQPGQRGDHRDDNDTSLAQIAPAAGGPEVGKGALQIGSIFDPVPVVAQVNVSELEGPVLSTINGAAITAAIQSLRQGERGTVTFTTVTEDHREEVVTLEFTAVNDPPVAQPDTGMEVSPEGNVVVPVLDNDSDPDVGDTITVVAVSAAAHGTTGIAPDATSVVYTPDAAFVQSLGEGQSETDSFTYTVEDSFGAQATATVTVLLTGTNDAPTAADDDATAAAAGGVAIAVRDNDSDPDTGDSLTVVAVGPAAAGGTVAIAAGGSGVVYTPDAAQFTALGQGQTATDSFTYTVQDGFGAQATATVTVTLAGVNDAPVAQDDEVADVAAPGALTVSVLDNDSDPDANDGLTVVAVGSSTLGGAVAIAAEGAGVTYAPDAALLLSLGQGQTATDSFTYTVQDGFGAQATATVTVTLTGSNDAPVAAADQAAVTADAGPVQIQVLANDTDPDAGDSATVTALDLAGTAGSVSIAPGGAGILYAPGSAFRGLAAGQTATDSFAYTVRDAAGAEASAVVTVTVTGVNDTPTDIALNGSTVAENAALGTVVGTLAASDPDAADTATFTLLDDAGGRFAIVGNELRVAGALEFETAASHQVTVRVTDAGGLAYDESFTIGVTNANEAPNDIALTGNTVAENAAIGAVVGTLAASDPDTADTATFTLLNDAGGRFAIVGNELRVAGALDFETAASHQVTVRVTDAGGLSYDESFTIGVTNANETPTDIALTGSTVAENAAIGAVVGTLAASDPDAADTATFTLLDDAGGRFAIVGNELRVAGALDFESATSHQVTVRVTDAGGLSYDETFAIGVTNANEAPADIALTGNSVAENAALGAVVGTLAATDPDAADTATFTLLDDAGARFAIVGNELRVAGALDFETAASHQVTVRVTDAGGLSYDESFTIGVTNANEAPADIALTGSTVAENAALGAVVGTLAATDPDAADTATFTLLDDAGGRFAIVGNELRVAGALDFETAASHQVTVRVTDAGGLSYDESFTIGVTNANEAPADIALTGNTVAENAALGAVVGTLAATDPDAADTATFTLLDDAGGRFAIVGNELRVAGALDFEAATSHQVTVRVTDSGGLSYDASFTIGVTNANEVPADIALTGSTVAENAALGAVVGTLAASDPDVADTATFTLLDDAGGRFAIVGNELRVAGALDFEGAASHQVTVRVTDAGGLSYDENFTIGVTNANEAPTDIALTGNSVAENSAIGTVVGTLAASDPDAADTATFTLLDDAGGRFAIVGNELRVAGALDFEAAASHQVTVRVTDAGGLSYGESFTVGVTDVPEAPLATADTAAAVEDGPGVSIDVLANDTDPNAGGKRIVSVNTAGTLGSVSIVGGLSILYATAGAFQSLAHGQTATDTFTYTMENDAGLQSTAQVTVTVTGVNDAPVITSDGGGATASLTVMEGSTAVTTVTASDVDAGAVQTFAIIGGADQARFTIDSGTGLLSFLTAPNMSQPGDAGGDNVYDVIVQASDGIAVDSQAIAVQITPFVEPDENDFDNLGLPGPQLLSGGNGGDLLYGGAGEDTIEAGSGIDLLYGGSGNDVIVSAGAGADQLFGGSGADDITSSAGSDTLVGGLGDDNIEAGSNEDLIYGGAGNDTIQSNQSTDTIFGGEGNDVIDGGDAADMIQGDGGIDRIDGGAGADQYLFTSLTDGGTVPGNQTAQSASVTGIIGDVVMSFVSGEDKLVFQGPEFDPEAPFVVIGAAYDGTNQQQVTSGAAFVFDSVNNLNYDPDVTTPGYTVVAHLPNGNINPATDIQVG